MAIFDLNNELSRAQFKERCNHLYRKGCRVELAEKKGIRTLKQNSYLHLLLAYFALQIGEKMEYVKQELFKRRVNHNYFAREREDRFFGKVLILRSSADLDTKEMTDCIERFRDWSAKEADIYLPAPNEVDALRAISREIEEQKRYIE